MNCLDHHRQSRSRASVRCARPRRIRRYLRRARSSTSGGAVSRRTRWMDRGMNDATSRTKRRTRGTAPPPTVGCWACDVPRRIAREPRGGSRSRGGASRSGWRDARCYERRRSQARPSERLPPTIATTTQTSSRDKSFVRRVGRCVWTRVSNRSCTGGRCLERAVRAGCVS